MHPGSAAEPAPRPQPEARAWDERTSSAIRSDSQQPPWCSSKEPDAEREKRRDADNTRNAPENRRNPGHEHREDPEALGIDACVEEAREQHAVGPKTRSRLGERKGDRE